MRLNLNLSFVFSFLFCLSSITNNFQTYAGTSHSSYPNGLFPIDLSTKSSFGYNQKVKVYFSLPPYLNPGGIGLKSNLLKFINQARTSLNLSFFQINQPEIINALIQAKRRGVKVTLITDQCWKEKDNYKESFIRLEKVLRRDLIFDLSVGCNGAFQHNKYAISDYETSSKTRVWIGTYNPTDNGSVENINIALEIKSPKLAKILMLDFEQMVAGKFQNSKDYILQSGQKIIKVNEKEIKELVSLGKQLKIPSISFGQGQDKFTIEILQAPKNKSIRRIIEEVYLSKKEVLFSAFAIADPMLISAFLNKSHATPGFYNKFPIALKKYPWEHKGLILRDSRINDRVLWDSKINKKMGLSEQRQLKNFSDNLKTSISNYKIYLGAKGLLKKTYNIIMPKGHEGGSLTKVNVEGIFNYRIAGSKKPFFRLKDGKLPIYQVGTNGNLHSKLILIDEEVTIIGSHNFSQSAEDGNDETALIIKNKALGRFIKNYYYKNLTYFTKNHRNQMNYSETKLAITEVMAETNKEKVVEGRKIDNGEFIELYNYGNKAINLFGMRISDHYYPTHNNEKIKAGQSVGATIELVPLVNGEPQYSAKRARLEAKKFALIVNKTFNVSAFKKRFDKNYYSLNKRMPRESDYPIFLTCGYFKCLNIGDARGLTAKDKITLYGQDRFTVIDRFDYPVELVSHFARPFNYDSINSLSPSLKAYEYLNHSIERNILRAKLPGRRVVKIPYQKGEKHIFHTYMGHKGPYSKKDDWYINLSQPNGSPGFYRDASRNHQNDELLFLDQI